MKALSIRQPWTELILQGRKTIELRTFNTPYRGTLLLHAAQRMKMEACQTYALNPDTLARGALVGQVELVAVLELDETQYEALREEHLCPTQWTGEKLYAWQFRHPTRLPHEIAMHGKQGLFSVEENSMRNDAPTAQVPPPTPPTPPQVDLRYPFEIMVEPRDEHTYALALYQLPVGANGAPPQLKRVVALSGVNLQVIADHVIDAIKKAGYKPTDLSPRRRVPFKIAEEQGVRLGLLFLTVAPLSRVDRIEAISRELRDMSSEEAYYWYSKCTLPDHAGRAQQALRVLLAAE